MAGYRPTIYWDTCTFLAWLLGEEHTSDSKEGMRYWVERVRAQEAVMVTSVITFAEVLRSKIGKDRYDVFSAFATRYTIRRSVDPPVVRVVHDLRDHFSQERDAGRVPKILCTPDAIHLATGIIYKCTQFHTFDGLKGHQGRCLGLLPLNGQLPDTTMNICTPKARRPPSPPQQELLEEPGG